MDVGCWNLMRVDLCRSLWHIGIVVHTTRSVFHTHRLVTLNRVAQVARAESVCGVLRASRPREKIHRPQTRRRRENNVDSLEKMQLIRRNMKHAAEVLDVVTRREQRKAHIAVRAHHRPPPLATLMRQLLGQQL